MGGRIPGTGSSAAMSVMDEHDQAGHTQSKLAQGVGFMRKQASLGLAGLGLSLIVLLSGTPSARADRDSDSHGWLGIFTQSLTSELREGLDYRGDGVLVNRVIPDSPADKAGIEKGDVIVSVNMRPVDSPDQLAEVIGNHHPGDEVSVRIVRNGDRRTLDVKLAPRGQTEDSPGDTPAVKDKEPGND